MNSSTDAQSPESGRSPRALAARLRQGHMVGSDVLAQVLEQMAAEVAGLQLRQANLMNRIKSLHSRGMQDGYSLIRREDAIRAVHPLAKEIDDE